MKLTSRSSSPAPLPLRGSNAPTNAPVTDFRDSVSLGQTPAKPAAPPLAWKQAAETGKSAVAQGAAYHSAQAFEILDRLLQARDTVTGLLPLHVTTDASGNVVATDHVAAGLDMGRQTAGLVMAADVAAARGDQERAARYLAEAEHNYAQGKKLLEQGDFFVQRRTLNPDGSIASTEVGEPGKSADGRDEMTRVNPRGYAFRGAAELFRATGKPEYKNDLERYFAAWVRDFHDPVEGGFFLHANINVPGDHTERDTLLAPDGSPLQYDASRGVKHSDGTIYALSGVLLAANEVLRTPQTQSLVKESMDILLDRFTRQNGMLRENYTADFQPVSQGWQNQTRVNGAHSHVAIGGHTAMAPQQIIEGARQLLEQGVISQGQYDTYLRRSVELFQDFATQSGALDWERGVVFNAIRVDEPDPALRPIREWGEAGWQQAELLQTLVRFEEEGCLNQIAGPDGKNGTDLLVAAQRYYEKTYSLPANYSFNDYFGNPDVYHRPQVAQYFQQALGTRHS